MMHTELLSPKIWINLEKLGRLAVQDSKLSETSCFQSQMQFDDSSESIADSDLEDGELQKMLTSPLKTPENFGETRCIARARERGKCTIDSGRKRKFDVSLIWKSEIFGDTRCIVFIWAGNPDQELCSQKRQPVAIERISSWRQQGSLAQSSEIRPGEARASCRAPQQVHHWSTTTNGRAKIGVTECQS